VCLSNKLSFRIETAFSRLGGGLILVVVNASPSQSVKKIMRQRSFLGLIAAGVLVLLLGIAGFYWFLAKNPLPVTASTSQPGAAIFVSKQAPAMVSMLVNPERLEALEGEGELSKLKTSLLANTGIDYKQDIQPWLGNEITLAVTTLDIDRDSENGRQLGYLMALATTKPEKSREFVNLLFSKRALAGVNLTVEEYKGIKLIYDDSQPEKLLAGAAVGDEFVLFANDPKVLRDAINNVQAPDLNLRSSPQYQKATKQVPKGSLAVAFLNLPVVAEWQGFKLPEQSEQIYNSQIISLALPNKGLLAETSLLASEEIVPSSEQLAKPVGALQYIPASAGLAIAGSNLSNLNNSDLAKLWQQITVAVSASREKLISTLLQPLGDVEKRWNINFAQDIFNWVPGEYALALLPRQEQTTPDWIFVAEKSEATPEGISHLDAIASSRGLNNTSLDLDNQKISTWTELKTVTTNSGDAKNRKSFTIEAKVYGAHTNLGNYEIFTSNLETMDEALKAKGHSLIDNRNFQDSIAAIPRPNQGYVYLDWTKSQKLLEQELPILKLVKVVGKPFFNNLRSLTVSSYGSETGTLKGGVFFKLDGA
jgi:Protein of unknown function (DUF3352)